MHAFDLWGVEISLHTEGGKAGLGVCIAFLACGWRLGWAEWFTHSTIRPVMLKGSGYVPRKLVKGLVVANLHLGDLAASGFIIL